VTRRQALRLRALLLALGLCLATGHARSHPIDSTSLKLTEVADGRFVVAWQTTSATLMHELRQPAVFPKPCRLKGVELDCGPVGLAGAIELPWLKGSETRVMVQIDWRSGSRLLRVVDGSSPSLIVYGIPASAGLRFLRPIAVDYTRLGIGHILTGFDHLLFVLAITSLVRSGKRLVAAITAFTVAHSLTLAATVLGWLWLPSVPVETAIALSIVLACAECLRPSDSLTHRAPWLVTFAFGLLHGMGFASALMATGLPERHVPSALLFFNVGVELGQLFAIALFIALGWLVTRLRRRGVVGEPRKRPAWLARGFIYAMGAVAAFWSIERGVALLSQEHPANFRTMTNQYLER
jgi:hydrogenase/urease accessory protein HupE